MRQELKTKNQEPVIVVAAVVMRDGRFLVCRRGQAAHLPGFWEFPGGKCEVDETLQQALEREIREELGTAITIGENILMTEHAYSNRVVRLHFFSCDIRGEPIPLIGQEIRWVDREELFTLTFPPADEELLKWLRAHAR